MCLYYNQTPGRETYADLVYVGYIDGVVPCQPCQVTSRGLFAAGNGIMKIWRNLRWCMSGRCGRYACKMSTDSHMLPIMGLFE
jgi:hypothetical protein